MRYDNPMPHTPREIRRMFLAISVLIVAIFVLTPQLMKLIDPMGPGHRPSPIPSETPPPPAQAEVTHISTYATSELHNVRVSLTVHNTGAETHSFTVTVETATTKAVVSVWDVPPGKSGSNDNYASQKANGNFVKNHIPDPPLKVTDIFQF